MGLCVLRADSHGVSFRGARSSPMASVDTCGLGLCFSLVYQSGGLQGEGTRHQVLLPVPAVPSASVQPSTGHWDMSCAQPGSGTVGRGTLGRGGPVGDRKRKACLQKEQMCPCRECWWCSQSSRAPSTRQQLAARQVNSARGASQAPQPPA